MKVFVTSLFIFALLACSTGPAKEEQAIEPNVTSSEVQDSSSQLPTIAISEMLISLIKMLPENNQFTATGYAFKRHYFDEKSCGVFSWEDHEMVSFPYSSSAYHKGFKHLKEMNDPHFLTLFEVDSFPECEQILGRVLHIHAFSWCKKQDNEGYQIDGVVEEWNYASEKEADQALQVMKRLYGELSWPYLKIGHFLAQHKNCIYVLHSRSTGWNYHNKPLYEHIMASS